MTTGVAILLLHAAATWFMTGLIWFVQVVHYPLMSSVGVEHWTGYAARHRRCTTLVVGPLMLVEAATCLLLLPPVASLTGLDRSAVPAPAPALAWGGLALLIVIWGSTALLQVPMHDALADGYDRAAQRRLVQTNWVRTIGWTARALIAAAMLAHGLG